MYPQFIRKNRTCTPQQGTYRDKSSNFVSQSLGRDGGDFLNDFLVGVEIEGESVGCRQKSGGTEQMVSGTVREGQLGADDETKNSNKEKQRDSRQTLR